MAAAADTPIIALFISSSFPDPLMAADLLPTRTPILGHIDIDRDNRQRRDSRLDAQQDSGAPHLAFEMWVART